MRRRAYLAAAGGVTSVLSGCLGTLSGGDSDRATSPATTTVGPTMADDLPSDPEPKDGYPPAFSETPEPTEYDTGEFEVNPVDGTDVPLAPIEAAYNWYATGRARFADARGKAQYERSHVLGAVSSPAGDDSSGDPVLDWPKGDRVVCYCGCPHHLSSMRAASLVERGYSNVFVIDEGFWAWHERSYPMAGESLQASPRAIPVDGVADPRFAGEYAWAVHAASGQTEAAPIGADGRFTLELRFSGVTESTPIVVRTPGYEVEAPLGDLAAGVVRPGE